MRYRRPDHHVQPTHVRPPSTKNTTTAASQLRRLTAVLAGFVTPMADIANPMLYCKPVQTFGSHHPFEAYRQYGAHRGKMETRETGRTGA